MFLCVSPNPAIDKRLQVEKLALGGVNRAIGASAPGGKDAHVAMVLKALSADLLVAETDILFVNETEALQLSNEPDVAAALAYLGTKTSCVVIKCGSRGAMGIRNGKIAFEHGFPVQAIDTTEAGDSVAAGFVCAYLTGSDLPGCLEVGNACGAMSGTSCGRYNRTAKSLSAR